MFHVSDVVQLEQKEQVQALIRTHSVFLWAKLAISACFLVVPFFFLFHLLRAGTIGAISFGLLTSTGILLAIRSFILWDARVLVLTNKRLLYVQQRSLWHRVVSETPLSTIRDLQWERTGIIETLLHAGTLRIKTGAGSVPDITAVHIPEPEEVIRAIKELRDHHHAPHQKTEEKEDQELTLDERREQLHAWISEAPKHVLMQLEALKEKSE
ncbi:PH domain-containing protein [Patescibacteria group bacterium]|nr:PH domain-containing protein [Patescibacteria group bacterium]